MFNQPYPTGSISINCEPQISTCLYRALNLVRDQGVGGSNPLSPTNVFNSLRQFSSRPKIHCSQNCRHADPRGSRYSDHATGHPWVGGKLLVAVRFYRACTGSGRHAAASDANRQRTVKGIVGPRACLPLAPGEADRQQQLPA